MLLEFPSEDDWRKLAHAYPYEKLEVSEKLFPYTAHPRGSIERFAAVQDIFVWAVHLQNRIAQTRWSHMLFMFYFNKGIPDDEWFISPGRKGQSVEYYPHFNERDHDVKMMFDYYVDVFYYKLFSSWDNLGHLLNTQYALDIRRANFDTAVKKLEAVNHSLWLKLKGIQDSSDFDQMRKFRHMATHNEMLGHIGLMVGRPSKQELTFGTGGYTPSKRIQDNAVQSLDLFAATIAALREEAARVRDS